MCIRKMQTFSDQVRSNFVQRQNYFQSQALRFQQIEPSLKKILVYMVIKEIWMIKIYFKYCYI